MIIKAKDKGDFFYSKMELLNNGIKYKNYLYNFNEIVAFSYDLSILTLKRSWGNVNIKQSDKDKMLNYAKEYGIVIR